MCIRDRSSCVRCGCGAPMIPAARWRFVARRVMTNDVRWRMASCPRGTAAGSPPLSPLPRRTIPQKRSAAGAALLGVAAVVGRRRFRRDHAAMISDGSSGDGRCPAGPHRSACARRCCSPCSGRAWPRSRWRSRSPSGHRDRPAPGRSRRRNRRRSGRWPCRRSGSPYLSLIHI